MIVTTSTPNLTKELHELFQTDKKYFSRHTIKEVEVSLKHEDLVGRSGKLHDAQENNDKHTLASRP
jgi:hypothetical protein